LTSALIALASLMFLEACAQSEVRGTYEVEIEIAQLSRPIGGTLILSTSILGVPPLTDEERALDAGWIDSDAIDANSCFVLHGQSNSGATVQNIRVFEARLGSGQLALPVDIYKTPLQRIEIVELQFFANAIGGQIVFHDGNERRTGRIYGDRTGAPSPQRCRDELQTFREGLRAVMEEEEEG
jgi:hypothetical protein